MMYDFNFQTYSKVNSVVLHLIDNSGNLHIQNMESDDQIIWRVYEDLPDTIKYFAYLLNNEFWICSQNHNVTANT